MGKLPGKWPEKLLYKKLVCSLIPVPFWAGLGWAGKEKKEMEKKVCIIIGGLRYFFKNMEEAKLAVVRRYWDELKYVD